VGEVFNIASPKQLAFILFEKMKIPPLKKNKTGYSTDSDVLEKLRVSYPVVEFILEHRELSKLKSTYVDSLPALVNAKTGRIHTHFNQALTSTGRLSSTNPNLQNIPIRTVRGAAIRKAFIAENGKKLISLDYSQIELRILAHITDDPGLCRAFTDDLDIHAATAAEVFGVSLADVTGEMRRAAKAINFGIAYGQGAFGLSESLAIPRKEAQEIINSYFNKFKGVKDYMEDTIVEAKKNGFVHTLFGRRRIMSELKSSSPMVRKFGERAAINAPIQGSSSDIVKKAMIAVAEIQNAALILQVHDELLFEVDENIAETVMKSAKEIMENIVKLKVPLKVNGAIGNNWDEAH
jgi:DNA polymerase-1